MRCHGFDNYFASLDEDLVEKTLHNHVDHWRQCVYKMSIILREEMVEVMIRCNLNQLTNYEGKTDVLICDSKNFMTDVLQRQMSFTANQIGSNCDPVQIVL